MSTSTDGILCFGWDIGDGDDVRFPWGADEGGGAEHWWYFTVHGKNFKPSVDPHDAEGRWRPGINRDSPEVLTWLKEVATHESQCPKIPFDLINYCSDDYPMWIFAVAGTERRASRGFPVAFKPSELVEPDPGLVAAAKSVLVGYFFPMVAIAVGEPRWYLCSYWG